MKKLMSTVFAIFLALAATAVGCAQSVPPNPAPVIPTGTESCPGACSRMRTLKCDTAEDITMKDGSHMTCEDFCVSMQELGVWLNPACVATVTSCEDVEVKCVVGRSRN